MMKIENTNLLILLNDSFSFLQFEELRVLFFAPITLILEVPFNILFLLNLFYFIHSSSSLSLTNQARLPFPESLTTARTSNMHRSALKAEIIVWYNIFTLFQKRCNCSTFLSSKIQCSEVRNRGSPKNDIMAHLHWSFFENECFPSNRFDMIKKFAFYLLLLLASHYY